jgi:phosphopantothenoylcysteine decarboxylase
VCIGASGSIAAVKVPEIVAQLVAACVFVDVVLTTAAERLMAVQYKGEVPLTQLDKLCSTHDVYGVPFVQVWRDEDEWTLFRDIGEDPVLHIELAKRNQVLLLAPLCANTLADISLGIGKNLLGSMVRAWYYDLSEEFAAPLRDKFGDHAVNKPVIAAPAMNTFMWYQRITGEHIQRIEARGVRLAQPVSKMLACGDEGKGAMADVSTIIKLTMACLDDHTAAVAAAARAGKPAFITTPARL